MHLDLLSMALLSLFSEEIKVKYIYAALATQKSINIMDLNIVGYLRDLR